MKYKEALEYIDDLWKKSGISMGLDNMNRLLDMFDRPENSYKIIHIAGTNGKGSVAAFLASILSEAGCKIGRYVSPVISDYTEKIQFTDEGNVKCISKKSVSEYIGEISCLVGKEEDFFPSPFEVETLMALMAFRDANVDYAIIECGMGGKMDATNAVSHKEMCIFTSIDYDHMNYLGNTLEAIAADKAEIINCKCPVVSAKQCEAVKHIIDNKAYEFNQTLVYPEKISQCNCSIEGTTFIYRNESYKINLLGSYQPDNAALAIEAAGLLLENRKDFIANGLMNTRWPGRFEILSYNPLVVFDGAHNPVGVKRFVESVNCLFEHDIYERIAIIGAFADKDIEKMAEYLKGQFDEIHTVTAMKPRGEDAAGLSERLRTVIKDEKIYSCDNKKPMEVINELVKNRESGKKTVYFVFGSLSLYRNLKC